MGFLKKNALTQKTIAKRTNSILGFLMFTQFEGDQVKKLMFKVVQLPPNGTIRFVLVSMKRGSQELSNHAPVWLIGNL